MNTCKTCKFYTAPEGSEGRWMVCSNPKMKVADAWSDYKSLQSDGIGLSQQTHNNWEGELYVGEDFGCIHHEKII